MASPISSDGEWEKLSIHEDFNSSSSDEEATDSSNDEWCIIKNIRPKLAGKELILKEDSNDEEDNDAKDIILSLYDHDYNDEDRITDVMLQTLFEYFPELQNEENIFPLEHVEQNWFPFLGTEALLYLKLVCSRWDRWISSDFFIHMQSMVHRKISGVFYHDAYSNPAFSSLGECLFPKDMPLFGYLSEHVMVKSTTYGLVVCRGKVNGNYYVCNPVTSEWVMLPDTKNAHGADTSVVIVLKEPLAYNFNKDYYVVCSYEIFEGIYGFETFSSENWTWNLCNEIVAAEKIVPNSGVAVNGKAYWRTTMQNILAFRPDLNVWEEMVWNNGQNSNGDWTIGELGKKLCVVNIEEQYVEVWTLENDGWASDSVDRDNLFEFEKSMPLSTQGEKEIIIWDKNKKIVALDVENGSERELGYFMPPYCADFVPYISTLVHVSGTQKHIGSTGSLAIESSSQATGIMSHEQQKGKEYKFVPTKHEILSISP